MKVEGKGRLRWLGNGTTREAYGTPHSTVMSDPIYALTYTLLPYLLSTRQDPPSGRLCPLLVGRAHPKRRMGRWKRHGIVKISRRFHADFTQSPECHLKAPVLQSIWAATARLLSSRSWVRITQGALPETAAKPGNQSVRARDPTERTFEPKQPETPISRHLLPGSEMGIHQLGYCGAPDCALPGRGRRGG